MSGGDERSEVGRGICGPANVQAFGFLLHGRNEPVENWPLDINSFRAKADLTSIQEHGVAHLLNGFVELAITEYDSRIFAAKFKRDRLHACSARLHDGSTGARFASKRDGVDFRMAHQVFTSRTLPKSMHEVKDAVWDVGIAHHFSQQGGAGGGFLGRLRHDGVAAGQRRRDLPRQQQERKVPRCNDTDYADRLAYGVIQRLFAIWGF